ncbi:MAG: carboxypeptidase regulatory-like domain-containing protein [Desulfamplus sp.]|nr:carboxypeptidase regulatory-like domain-containing protein [Desulfamplus sp.]
MKKSIKCFMFCFLWVCMVSATCPSVAQAETIFNNFNGSGVYNGPGTPTQFSVSSSMKITNIMTYHWNNGSGTPPETIAIKHSDGTVYGPWTATGYTDVKYYNMYWNVYPQVVIKAGTYTIVDSGNSTWSYNSGSGNAGFAQVYGEAETSTTQPPTATTSAASSVTATSATLNGTVNPNGDSTTWYFDYGTSTGYGSVAGSQNSSSGTVSTSVTANLTGLTANTTYHFRLVATNSAGTTNGSDQTLKTAATSDSSGLNPPDGISAVDETSNPNNAPIYMGNIVNSSLSGKMELSVNFPAYNKSVDIWILIALPDGRFYTADESGKLLLFESNDLAPVAAGVSGTKTEKTILTPFEVGAAGTSFDPWPKDGTWTVYWLIAPDSNGDIMEAIDNGDYELGFYTFIVKEQPATENTEVKLGMPTTYEVTGTSATAVKDSVSGCTFLFPDGGNGTLSVAPVLSAPEIYYPATKIAVEYSGEGNVEIAVPHTEGNEDVLFVYTQYPPHIAVDDVTGDYTWFGVAPSEQRDDATVFSISSDLATEPTAKLSRAAATTTVVLAFSSVPRNSPERVKMDVLRESVRQAVSWWLDNLPSSLASSARTQIEGDLRYGIAWTTGGNCYDHAPHMFGPDAIIELNWTTATSSTVAHEVGHYMTHVLVGYNRYVEIIARMPTNWYGGFMDHAFGDYVEFRKYLLEEYAYLSDYLINGTANYNNLIAPAMSTIFGKKGPDEKDFPSFEGFGSLMFGSLLRSDPKVKSFWQKGTGGNVPIEDTPVVDASVADVLGIFARGARDTNELRQYIQDYLDSRGNADRFKLPAMLEPLGWSYNGNGKVVDSSNKPVKGVHVQSICQDGTKEYSTFMSPLTGDDGIFWLPRIYPGTNILRFFWNDDKDKTDVSFTVDWNNPTNKSIQMGTFTINNEVAPTEPPRISRCWYTRPLASGAECVCVEMSSGLDSGATTHWCETAVSFNHYDTQIYHDEGSCPSGSYKVKTYFNGDPEATAYYYYGSCGW